MSKQCVLGGTAKWRRFMNTKTGLIGLAALVIVVIGAVAIFNEADDGPLENAAEELDNAAEDVADEIEDGVN